MNDKIKILVVEDEAEIRKILKEFLVDNLGLINTIFVENGKIAQSKITSNKVDLLITDLDVPNFDGRQLVRWMNSVDKFKNIPIIVMSGESQEDGKELVNEKLAKGFIEKPFRFQKMEKMIESLIQ